MFKPIAPGPRAKPPPVGAWVSAALLAGGMFIIALPAETPSEPPAAHAPRSTGTEQATPPDGGLQDEEASDTSAPLSAVQAPGPVTPDDRCCGCFSPMTPPELLEGPPIFATPEAVAAGVTGTMLVKCLITVEGRVHDCRVLKSLPHMEEAVVEALRRRRYRPAMFEGKPLETRYAFTVRIPSPG